MRIAAVLLIAVAGLSLVGTAQTPARKLLLVSTAWPPFTNAPGQPRFALDLVEAALGRIGFTAETTIVSAAQFTPSILSGKWDGSAAAWKDPEREKALAFSQPYLENRLILIGRLGSDVSAKTLSALKGKKVAIVEGYSYGDAIDKAGPIFVQSQSEEDSLRLLLTSAVDYTLMDDLVVQYIADHYADQAKAKLQIGTTPLIVRPLYLAIRRALPDAQAIVERFNGQLRTLIADRTYHRLLHVDWIEADVDGDGVPEYVPKNDQPGPTEPKTAYKIVSSDQPQAQKPAPTEHRYFVGGSLYDSWAVVPDHYKAPDLDRAPDPSRSIANIFTFAW